MDHKMLNLARAKKKLRYFRAEENSPCSLKIKDVFTLNDIDNIFDDLDSPSESSTSQLSPLPKSAGLVERENASHSTELKPPLGVEELEVLAPENDVQDNHINDSGSPFRAIAPIKTSSPVDMVTVRSGAGNAEQPDPSPMLFGGEDEEPIEGDFRLPPSNRRARSPEQFLQGDSDSLVSPPTRLEFGKPSNLDIVSVPRGTPLKSSALPDLDCRTSARPETSETAEALQTDRSTSPPPPPAVLQGSHSDPLPQEQRKGQRQDVEVCTDIKKTSSFQQKLRNALQPKTSCFRKQEPPKQAARAASPAELDDDFLILEDDAPILFTIPRRAERSLKGKTAPEVARPSFEGSEVEQAASEPTGNAESRKGEPHGPKLIESVKRGGKTFSENTETVAQMGLGEDVESLGANEEVEAREQISCPALLQELKSRKKIKRQETPSKPADRAKGPVPRSLQEIPRETQNTVSARKGARRGRKPLADELKSDSEGDQKNRKTARGKRKPKTVTVNQRETPSKTTMVTPAPVVGEEVEACEAPGQHSSVARSPPQRNRTPARKKAMKQPTTKQAASERLTKVRKVKTKEDSKRKECTMPERDLSAEGPVTGRRKRKPPGEWWLTQTQEEVAHQSLQELKSHKKIKRQETPSKPADCAKGPVPRSLQEIPRETQNTVSARKGARRGRKPLADELKSDSEGDQKNRKTARGKRKPKTVTVNQRETPSKTTMVTPAPVVGEEVEVCEAPGQHSSVARSPPQRNRTPGNKRMFDKVYTRGSQRGSAQKCHPSPLRGPETPSTWWEVLPSQRSPDSSRPPLNRSPEKPEAQKAPPCSASVVSSRKRAVHAQKINKRNMVNTPKLVRRSMATFDAILTYGKAASSAARGHRPKGCRNLLHSLEEQSVRSSDNVYSDGPQCDASDVTFDVSLSDVAMETVAASKTTHARLSAGSRVSDHDMGFKSGPSSMIELERFDEDEDADLPSSRVIPQMRRVPRVLADCDLCGPPLRPIVLEPEDWENLCVWLTHLWPSSSQKGRVISPDDFHWHSYGGRGMGHMVDLENNTFSNGKILLGSFMKKPPQLDLNAVTVFNVVSSCVRVEIEGVKVVYNSGQTFVTPCGQSYSIHNICREPAVLWYNRMLPNHSRP